jgi:hypothetical protein
MFVGHYGASLAAKGIDRRIPLWVLFVAAQFIDVLWSVFVFSGVEHVRIVEDFTAVNHLDLYYMPWTHGLTSAFGWSVVAAGIYMWLRNWRGWGGSAILVGAAVLSHWFVDLPMHVPDLPLYGNEHKQGFGLWNYRELAFVLEAVFLGVGLWVYMRATRAVTPAGRWAMPAYCAVMYAVFLGTSLGPVPPGPSQMAAMALASYLGLAAVAFWLERKRA